MSQYSRRDFLEYSLLSMAAASVSTVGSVSPAEGALKQASPNEVLRVAVIGVNGRGGSHLSEFGKRADCKIAALVDCDEEVLNKAADSIQKKHGHRPKLFTDLRKAYEDKDLDIASIATPNHWHSLAAIWAVQAGKDVYVEKPVSHNVVEGRRAVQAARKYNKIVQVGTQSRSNPGMRKGIEFLHQGGIGEVKLARGLCYKPRAAIGPRGNYDVKSSLDYDIWCGPAKRVPLDRPKLHYDWHWQWEFGNGDLGNQGVHQVDIARWGLGESSLGTTVMSYGGRLGYEDAGETANTQVCDHRFASGKRLVFEVRGLKTDGLTIHGEAPKVGVIFYGTEGFAVAPSYKDVIVFDKSGKKVNEFHGGSDADHFGNFVDAVRSRKVESLNADILEGHLSAALCHVANISYRLGEPQGVPQFTERLKGDETSAETLDRTIQHLKENGIAPETLKMVAGPLLTLTDQEMFTGQRADEANKMLTREYRAPYLLPTEATL